MADPAWIKLRDCGAKFVVSAEWRKHQTPENKAAWPAGHELGKMILESKHDQAVLLPRLHYTALANAYAELDPECIRGSGGQTSHISALPKDARELIRGYLLRYNHVVDWFWIEFAGVDVGMAKMPTKFIGDGRSNEVGYMHRHRDLCRAYAERLGAAPAEIDDYMNGPQACEYCKLDYGQMCSTHAGRRDEMLAGQDQLISLCTSPPLPK